MRERLLLENLDERQQLQAAELLLQSFVVQRLAPSQADLVAGLIKGSIRYLQGPQNGVGAVPISTSDAKTIVEFYEKMVSVNRKMKMKKKGGKRG